jgi:hypothetical protein
VSSQKTFIDYRLATPTNNKERFPKGYSNHRQLESQLGELRPLRAVPQDIEQDPATALTLEPKTE